MLGVIGILDLDIKLHCPHCEGRLNLAQYPYDKDSIREFVFRSIKNPAEMDGARIEYECSHCKKAFALTGIRY